MSTKQPDQKYVLLGPNKYLDKKVYGVPWYEERVVEKLRRQEVAINKKSRHKLPVSKLADSSRWIFLKDGLDDFRDGLPPVVSNIFIRLKDNFPMTKPDPLKVTPLKQAAVKNRFTKEEACFSRTIPLLQRRRDNVADVERGLLAHRLALFPHLMEAVPQEILEDVVTILDPEAAACVEVEDEDDREMEAEEETDMENRNGDVLTPLGRFTSGRTRQASATSTESAFTPFSAAIEKSTPPSTASPPGRPGSSKNPYRWMYNRSAQNANLSPRREPVATSSRSAADVSPGVTAEKFRPAVDGTEQATSNNALDGDGERYVTQVTKTFCDWVRGLGGEETNNIEESTILSLFAAGYETKPSLLVPIKVVELQNIPNELRVAAGVPPPSAPPKRITKMGTKIHVDPNSLKTVGEVEELKEEERKLRSRANPDFGRMSYGAWYLPKKYWTKRDAELLLEDPRDVSRRKETDTFRRNIAIEEELAALTGSQSFLDFLQKKSRKPEFMQRVGDIMERIKEDGETGSVTGRPAAPVTGPSSGKTPGGGTTPGTEITQ